MLDECIKVLLLVTPHSMGMVLRYTGQTDDFATRVCVQ